MNFRATSRCLLLTTVLTVVFAACTAQRTAHDPFSAPIDQQIRVVVDNHNWEAMAVYVVRSGTPIRVGIVEGLSTRTLVIPASYLGSMDQVELMGQTRISEVRHSIPAVPLAAGRTLRLTLGSHPHLSMIRND